jgi:hypothetical protein
VTEASHWLKTALAAASPAIGAVYFVDSLPLWLRLGSIPVVGLVEGVLYHFGGDKEIQVILPNPVTPVEARDLLGRMIKSLFGRKASHYRANIMLVDETVGQLRMWAGYNMEAATRAELSFSFSPGQGCAGQAWQRNDLFFLDLGRHSHETYGVKSSLVSSTVKSILSVPVRLRDDVGGAQKIIGVLSIDSDLPFTKSRLGTDNLYTEAAQYAAKILGPALRNAR